MSIEAVLWGIIPVVAAITVILCSLIITFMKPHVGNMLTTLILSAASTFSLVLLYRIFVMDAWPTFIPHLLVCIGMAGVFVQWRVNKRASRKQAI